MNVVRSAKCEVRGATGKIIARSTPDFALRASRPVLATIIAIVIFCTPHFAPRTSHAQSSWRSEDRLVLGEMLRITAVASSLERLYVVSEDQVIYRDLGRGWSGPFEAPATGELLNSLGSVVDPLDRSLWIVTRNGWLRYDPILESWDRGFLTSDVRLAGIDRSRPGEGLFLRTAEGWVVAQRGSGFPMPVTEAPRLTDLIRAETAEGLARANPQLAGLLSGTLMGPGLRPVRLTAAAPAADQSGWWLGTDGAGLFWLPFGSATPESRPWGMPGRLVGAVAAIPGGVWAVTDRLMEDGAALVHVDSAAGAVQWFMGDRVFGQRFRETRALRIVDTLIWVGTDQGAFAMSRRGAQLRHLTEADGLADRRIFSIAARRGRLVLGTMHGIAAVTDSGVTRLAPTFVEAALAVAISGDTTWVGTRLGLFAHVPGEDDVRQAPRWDAVQLARTPVVALVWRGDTLVALTDRGLVWREPRTGTWTVGPDLSGQLGRPRAMADGDRGLWVAGARAVGFVRLGLPAERRFAEGDALPGAPWDVSVGEEYLWVGTSRGLVRFRRGAVEP